MLPTLEVGVIGRSRLEVSGTVVRLDVHLKGPWLRHRPARQLCLPDVDVPSMSIQTSFDTPPGLLTARGMFDCRRRTRLLKRGSSFGQGHTTIVTRSSYNGSEPQLT